MTILKKNKKNTKKLFLKVNKIFYYSIYMIIKYIFSTFIIINSLVNSYCYHYVEKFDKTIFNENFFNEKIKNIEKNININNEIRKEGKKYVYLEENFFFFEVEKLGNNYISKNTVSFKTENDHDDERIIIYLDGLKKKDITEIDVKDGKKGENSIKTEFNDNYLVVFKNNKDYKEDSIKIKKISDSNFEISDDKGKCTNIEVLNTVDCLNFAIFKIKDKDNNGKIYFCSDINTNLRNGKNMSLFKDSTIKYFEILQYFSIRKLFNFFEGCNNLEEAKFNVKDVFFGPECVSMFENLQNLKKVDLSNIHMDHNFYCFKNCKNLEEVTLLSGSGLFTECFKNCEKLKKIKVIDNKNDNIFNKDNKKKLTLFNSSFENCYNLEEIDVDYFYLGNDSQDCFKNCKKLKMKDIKISYWIYFEKPGNKPINVKNFFEGVDIEKNNKKFNIIVEGYFNENVLCNLLNCIDFFEHIVPKEVIYKDKKLTDITKDDKIYYWLKDPERYEKLRDKFREKKDKKAKEYYDILEKIDLKDEKGNDITDEVLTNTINSKYSDLIKNDKSTEDLIKNKEAIGCCTNCLNCCKK